MSPPYSIIFPQNRSPSSRLYKADLMFKQPASYSGHVVIEPNINLAYPYPQIKSIWGGTIEFPLTIEVMEKKSE